MTEPQQNPQLPSPKILLPVGIMFIVGAVFAFLLMDPHVVTSALAGLIGLAGVAMAVQSIMRLVRGEK
ncbi:hypothetical protein FB468_3235 [Leucobacter komagatae]|uniref:Uncharacterized protein n=1 Tax=Leucobacter komagatae TaxID=55969 RepID=A0A542XXZ7_9MICO|nr:hypothetical protein [Leucobacter komagatae]TQL40712.1 hypothetical protein FB468_3235 [Leucobacter komagatae]